MVLGSLTKKVPLFIFALSDMLVFFYICHFLIYILTWFERASTTSPEFLNSFYQLLLPRDIPHCLLEFSSLFSKVVIAEH